MSNCFYAYAGYKTIILCPTIEPSLSFTCSDYDKAHSSSSQIVVGVLAKFELLAELEVGKCVAEGLCWGVEGKVSCIDLDMMLYESKTTFQELCSRRVVPNKSGG
jgi:hypothetical protein